MVMKLYALADGPPSLAVRQALAHLEIPYEKINVDFLAGDHLTEKYAQVSSLMKSNSFLFIVNTVSTYKRPVTV